MTTPTRSFDDVWRTQGLDAVASTVSLGATATARTFAVTLARPGAAVTAPALPSISLGGLDSSAAPTEAALPLQDDKHDLHVRAMLGEGGMGRVLLAHQRSLGRDVAVKMLKPAVADLDGANALLREAVIMGGVEHPNVVPVHALGRDQRDNPVLVMKRIEGTSWADLTAQPEHPAWRGLLATHGDRLSAHLEVLMRVADAAHGAHARGVVHRDIKPDNVMVGAYGEVYLVDWGIAVRVGRDRLDPDAVGPQIRGTPTYMAPEMISGDPERVDARTDVYLLGATLHEVLTGTPRHQGTTLYAVLSAAWRSEPVRYGEEVPEELAALCNEATHADVARRPQSAQEFRRRVAEFLGHRASLTLTATARARLASLERAMDGERVDDVTTRRLAVEARFGFAQALEVWPGNPRAAEGLARTLRRLFDYELSRENLDAARALAAELGDAGDETRARLDALAATLAARKEREAAALQEARERDFSVGARERLLLMGALALLSLAATVTLVSPGRGTVRELLRNNGAMLAVFVLAGVAARRRVLVNRINRQSYLLGLTGFSGTFLHRLLTHLTEPARPIAPVLAVDELLLTMVCVFGAFTVRPWVGWLGLFAAAGGVLSAVLPERAMLWFALSSNVMLLACVYFGWASRADDTPT